MKKIVKKTESFQISREELENLLQAKLIEEHIDMVHVADVEFNWDLQCDRHGDDQQLNGVKVVATILMDEGDEDL